MHSSYSPLFTSGLLAERRAGSSSSNRPNSTTPSVIPFTSVSPPTDDDHPSAFYFTFQSGRRDTVEFRSFLSLDLASSNPSVASHKRKPSNISKSTSWTCTSDITSAHDLSRIERPVPPLLSPLPSAFALRRASRESLRQIPSPKPAPSSATLPEPPTSLDSVLRSSPAPMPHVSVIDASFSAPVLSPTLSSGKLSSMRSSSITSHQKRKSRMNALACLEGRSRAANRIPRPGLRKNFMSMSDDEGDESKAFPSPPDTSFIQVEDFGSFADIEDEAEAIVSSRHHPSPKQTTVLRSTPQPVKRKRRSTVDSWFPLKSFIDLKDDDLSWNWRSFIEIGGIS